jgi:hypothetical protein
VPVDGDLPIAYGGPVRLGPISGVMLLVLACAAVLAGTASAAAPQAAEEPSLPAGFRLQGSHGFTIFVSAYPEDEGSGHGAITVTASRAHESVSYTAPAKVTSDSIHARLGSLGRVDLDLHLSGGDETASERCFHHQESFQAGTYEGVFEFDGEGGYTTARATRMAGLPWESLYLGHFGCGGQGFGESFGPEEPGARLLGVSFANGRTVKFQFNKNRPAGKTVFTASLAERRNGIKIYRELSGVTGAGAFHYGAKVRTATLSPPAPFLGTAHLTRNRNSVSPLLGGDLKLAFPGHTVKLTGPAVHVSLEHARMTHGNSGSITTYG